MYGFSRTLFAGIAAGLLACIACGPVSGSVGSVEPRIVSLSPHITELLFAAGAGARVVGVDDSSDFPAEARGIARVGEPAALDLEGLLALSPSVIVAWESGTPMRVRAELARLQVRVLMTEQRRLDDIGATIEEFGRLAGTAAVADEAARHYRAELAELRARHKGHAVLRVFYQVWDRPLYTLSGKHVVSEVLSLCGGENVFGALSTVAPAVDREAVLAADPDVILIADLGADGERQRAAWRAFPTVRAVRMNRVFLVDPSLLGRMSPRILLGIEEVCSALEAARGSPVSNIRQSPNDNSKR